MKKVVIILILSIIQYLGCVQKHHSKIKKVKGNKEVYLIENIHKNNETTSTELFDFSINIIDGFSGLISNNINSLIFIDDSLYICSDNGISKINNSTGKILNINFTNGYIKNFFNYKQSFFLITTTGLYILTNNNISLISNIIFQKNFVLMDNSDILLFSENGELYCFDMDILKMKKTFLDFRDVKRITGIDNTFFIVNEDKLLRIKNRTVKTLINNYNNGYDLYYFGDNNLYLTGNSIIKISDSGEKNFLYTLTTNEFVTYLLKDKNILYIGKNNGLAYYNLSTQKYKLLLTAYKVKNSYISYILKAKNNTLYLGTKGSGLIKYMFDISPAYKN